MTNLFILCRGYVVFVSFSFLFGQAFFANFDWGASIAGVFGILSGLFGGSKQSLSNLLIARLTTIFCMLGVFGVGLDALNYYQNFNSAGSYYAWFLVGPHLACLVAILAYTVYKLPPSKQTRKQWDGLLLT